MGTQTFISTQERQHAPPNESSAVQSRVPSPVFRLEALPGAAVPSIRTEVVRESAFVGVHYDLEFRLKKAASPNQLSTPPLSVESHMRDDLIQLDDWPPKNQRFLHKL